MSKNCVGCYYYDESRDYCLDLGNRVPAWHGRLCPMGEWFDVSKEQQEDDSINFGAI